MQTLKLILPLPPSDNVAYTAIPITKKGSGYFKKTFTKIVRSEIGTAYFDSVQKSILEKISSNNILTEILTDIYSKEMFMDIFFVFKDNRIRDTHNYLGILLDTLQGILYENDCNVFVRIQGETVDKNSELGNPPPYIIISLSKKDIDSLNYSKFFVENENEILLNAL